MRTLTALLFAAVAFIATPAHSAAIAYDLDVISSSAIGTGSLGTVTLSEVGGGVKVVVDLADNTGFVTTGSHYAFAFSVGDHAITLSPTSAANFSLTSDDPVKQSSWYFDNGLVCTSCGNGSTNPYYGILEFTVSGVSLADFVSATDKQGHELGIMFSADVVGPNGGTGPIGADNPGTGIVPLPAALPLFGASLFGFGALARRRKAA